MKYLLMHYSDAETEAGVPPTLEFMAKMGKFMEEETKAGVLLAAEGVLPSAKGARLQFAQGQRTVTDGPFTEAKEVIAGFALVKVKSKAEAIEAATRFANLFDEARRPNIEIREIFDPADQA